ncbi:MAG: glycosyltransferase family 4 protein [Fibrobacteria bacterium]|nr:glycosyltransferase family 4 protein [Fibrobacteria bacterium]
MRTFASVDTFVESSASSLRLGRLVANATFLESLLREGIFDRHVLFCPSEAERSRLESFLSSRPEGEQLLARCDLRPIWDLPRALREESLDVIHSGGWNRYLPALAWLRARHAPRPIPLTGPIHSINNPDQAIQIRRLCEAPLRSCDAVFCTSTEGRTAFARQIEVVGQRHGIPFGGRLEHVPLGVDERYFHPPERSQARQRLKIPESVRMALWIGRLSPASKADLVPLLYQWSLLVGTSNSPIPSPLLVLAGGATSSDELALRGTVQELGLQDHVRILRDIEDTDKLDLLGAADVFVSPVDNHQETFGIAVVEAMAAGLPIVCSDWDGYRDLVDHGGSGLRVPVLAAPPVPSVVELRGLLEPDLAQLAVSQAISVDPRALRESLEAMLADPEGAKAMGRAARERARRLFSWRAVLQKADAVWTDLGTRSRSLAWPPSGEPDPGILDPSEVFANYPTGLFQAEASIELSALGERILAGRLPMPATWKDLVPIADGRLMTFLAVSLRSGPCTRRELLDAACSRVPARPREAAAMLAWLEKYGIVEELEGG